MRYLLLTACSLALAAPAPAAFLVAPNSSAAAEGNTNNVFPLLVNGGQRYQQVYNSSEFSAFGGPQLISGITFRPDNSSGSAFTRTLSAVEFRLSTTATAADGLSGTFASNVGANEAVVRSGPLTISSSFTAGPGGTRLFDITIAFTTPFLYNPAAGNLLLDIRNTSPEVNNINVFFDATFTSGDSVSRVFGSEGTPGALSGSTDSVGLVTQFQFGPTPPALATPVPPTILMGVVGFGLMTVCRFARRSVAA